MYYSLIVESKVQKSPEEMEQERRGFNSYGMTQAGIDLQRYKPDRVLSVELSEEEFAAVKKGVLSVFK